MKKFKKILLIGIVASLCLAIVASAQDAPAAGGRGGMGAGRGGAGAGRGMMGMFGARGRGFNTDSINEALAAMEKQIAAIKKILAEAAEQTEAAGAPGGARGARGIGGAGGPGGEDFQARMAAMQERNAMVQESAGAIANQCLVLDSTPLQTEVTELQAALTQANEVGLWTLAFILI